MGKPPALHKLDSKNQTKRAMAVLAVSALGACGGVQSSLDPRGPQAAEIAGISWVMFAGATAILLLVMALALYAIYRAPDRRVNISANAFIAIGGLAFPVVALSALLVYGVWAMGSLRARPEPAQVEIEVVGNRWWWDVHYRDANGQIITTANEIHIPAGRPVSVGVRTDDVIHSFWVPNLAGKIDLIPGRTNRIVLQASTTGTFRGQCAEFCGAQHARMGFYVIAQTPESYAAWLEQQRAPAATPADGTRVRGRESFLKHCVQCHTVRGVGTARERGPDLTHVASRRFIAAGTLENNRDNLTRFITNSQAIKPGNGMPSHNHLAPETVGEIVSYLESLR